MREVMQAFSCAEWYEDVREEVCNLTVRRRLRRVEAGQRAAVLELADDLARRADGLGGSGAHGKEMNEEGYNWQSWARHRGVVPGLYQVWAESW